MIASVARKEGIVQVQELTGGDGTHTVLECVGAKQALEMAFGVVRDGGPDHERDSGMMTWPTTRSRQTTN